MSHSFARIIKEDTVASLRGLLQADLNKTKAAVQGRVKPEFSGRMSKRKVNIGLEPRLTSRSSGVGIVKPPTTNPFSSIVTPVPRAGPSKVNFSTKIGDGTKRKRRCECFVWSGLWTD